MVPNGAPLAKPLPIGAAHSEREISNCAGMILTKGLIECILSGALKFPWIKPFIKLHCYLAKGFEGGTPLLNRALLDWLIPNAKFQISPERA